MIAPDRQLRLQVVAWVVLLSGASVFVVVAWLRIPWHPVPGGHLQAAQAEDYFTGGQISRAESFARWARAWSWGSLALSLGIAAWLGFSVRGSRWLTRLRGPWWLRAPAIVASALLLGRVLTLPFAFALRSHLRAAGLTQQSWTGFARDLLVGEVIQIVTTALGVLMVVACARRLPTLWPAVAGGLLAGFVLLGSFAYPVVIEPLFNHFTSLPDGALRTKILQVAASEHVHVDDVLVADASRRTTTLNAYVSGFGDTRRVVLYDNLLDDTDQNEIISVVAHELTHARYDDVLTGSLLGAAGAFFGVGLGAVAMRRRDVGDPASVPRMLAMLALGSFLALPIQNTLSRQIETRADVGALEATRDEHSFIELQRQLALHSLADPTPPSISQFWFGSHPTVLMRIALAERMLDEGYSGTPSPGSGSR